MYCNFKLPCIEKITAIFGISWCKYNKINLLNEVFSFNYSTIFTRQRYNSENTNCLDIMTIAYRFSTKMFYPFTLVLFMMSLQAIIFCHKIQVSRLLVTTKCVSRCHDYYVKPIAVKLKVNPEIPFLYVVNTILTNFQPKTM